MVREARSRLEAMRAFFDECGEDARLCLSAYPPELLRRTIAQELAAEIAAAGVDSDGLDARLRGVDNLLHRVTRPADFQWDAQLRDAYPQAVYWWLYAAPPGPDKN